MVQTDTASLELHSLEKQENEAEVVIVKGCGGHGAFGKHEQEIKEEKKEEIDDKQHSD